MSSLPESIESGPSRQGYTSPSPARRVKRRRSSGSSSHDSSQHQRRTPQTRQDAQRTPSLAHLLHTTSPSAQENELDEGFDELVLSSDDERAEKHGHQAFSGLRTGGGNWTYHLEIIQHPQRARACGFGDKDRRPLSPPPIIRLWVKDASGKLVDPTHINIHFLMLMVDLWSADRAHQRSVVMHPGVAPASRMPLSPRPATSLEPTIPAPSSRPNTGGSAYGSVPNAWPGGTWRFASTAKAPVSAPTISPHTRQAGQDPTRLSTPLPVPPAISGWTPEAATRPSPARNSSYSRTAPMPNPELPRPTTAPIPARPPGSMPSAASRPFSRGLNLPSLASVTEGREIRRSSVSHLTLPAILDQRANDSDGRRVSWSDQMIRDSTEIPRPFDQARGSWHNSSLSSNNTRPSLSYSDRDGPGMGLQRPSTSTSTLPPMTPAHEHPPPHFASSQETKPFVSELHRPTSSGSAATPANYSRVLVGSLSAVCQRLQDDQGNPGLFFFAHDLGVRTEGTFTLKFCLMDLSSLMMQGIPGQKASVLAQTFSDPFTVYSAKRFPGVIPTTSLTRLFAAQNVRLPTRQKRAKGDSAAGSAQDDED